MMKMLTLLLMLCRRLHVSTTMITTLPSNVTIIRGTSVDMRWMTSAVHAWPRVTSSKPPRDGQVELTSSAPDRRALSPALLYRWHSPRAASPHTQSRTFNLPVAGKYLVPKIPGTKSADEVTTRKIPVNATTYCYEAIECRWLWKYYLSVYTKKLHPLPKVSNVLKIRGTGSTCYRK